MHSTFVCSVGLFSLFPASAALAQTPPSAAAPALSAREDCPIEQHPIAINPDVIACHAAFAPLPALPAEIDKADPAQVRKLEEAGDWLLGQLHRPDVCGKEAKLRVGQACAVIIYGLDEAHRQSGLPWTYLVRIYRITHPEDVRKTIIFAMNSNSSERRLGQGAEEIWHLLADVRVGQRCVESTEQYVGTSVSSGGMQEDKCRRAGQDIRYRPLLLLGEGEAHRVLNKESIRNHFYIPLQIRNAIQAGYGSPEN